MLLRLAQRFIPLDLLIVLVIPRAFDALVDVEACHTIERSITIVEDFPLDSPSSESLLQLTKSSVLYSDSSGSRISILYPIRTYPVSRFESNISELNGL